MTARSCSRIEYSLIGLLGAASACTPAAHAGDESSHATASHQSSTSPDAKRRASEFIRTVREATVRFRDVAAAQSEGYELHFGCVTGSDAGAMGLHYVNMSLVGDGKLDATRPEIVIYEPLANGRLRMIGADFLVLADAWHAHSAAPPELGGQLFHLFESPNRFGLPAFYTLHVWAWRDNPNGAFVNWHPQVSCDSFSG